MKTSATDTVTPGKPASAPVRKSRQREKSNVGKTHRHPWENRKTLGEQYEGELSGREGWWRTYIRETPIPGAYELESQHWLYDLERRPNTYRFKSDGRKVDPHPHGKGATLLPGAYEHKDFLKKFERDPATYGFKTGERDQFDVLNFGKKDKDINVSPNAYGVEKYLSLTVDKQPSRHSMFKSQAKRFPTIQFRPKYDWFRAQLLSIPSTFVQKYDRFREQFTLTPREVTVLHEGPAPGNYEAHQAGPSKKAVSSCFKSKTPRFSSSHTRVPGPGSYDKTFQAPQTGVLQKMGRQHGLFFSSAFQV